MAILKDAHFTFPRAALTTVSRSTPSLLSGGRTTTNPKATAEAETKMGDREQQRHYEGTPATTAPVSALALLGLFLVTLVPSPTAAVRIAFLADTGMGNDNPGDYWVDFYGNRQAPVYKVNGQTCYDFKGEPCRLYSRARDVIRGLKDNGAELIVHAGDLDYESAPKMWRLFVDETIRNQGMDYVASKGNHDHDGWDGVKWLWSGSEGYRAQLDPIKPYGCEGTYGEDMVCNYKGRYSTRRYPHSPSFTPV